MRDSNGRITGKTETSDDGTAAAYEYDYDAVGRLLTVTKDGEVAESYQYNSRPYGTRTYEERYGVGRSLNYNDEDNLLTAGDTTYQHDADGFLVSKTEGTQVTTYDYSLRGELLSVTLPDSTVIEYVHDPLGRRIAKKVNGTVVEKYLWQGLTRLLAVYDGSGNLLMRFEYADARMPAAMAKAGVTYYPGYDQVGSLKAVADASGNVVKKIEYDIFGNILSDSNPGFEVPFGFAGGLHDRDTGLVRFGYRDYDPETGRWTAKDPILFAGGDTDLYGYCVNDPVNWVDLFGLKMCGETEGKKCKSFCKDRKAEVLVCEETTTSNWAFEELTVTYCTCTDDDRWGGFRSGKPDVPKGSAKAQREVRKIKSDDFKTFLEKHDISKKGWHKVMEKYRTPSGRIIKKHWWEGPGGRCFYHK